ncbi:hypothetical protein ACFFX0_25940 [Citricoccus parietis]|uniref:Secreted protein n=1 Tax=Citricoccus parietis TaxID=592307 RepID=A0ABV5G688_9MICC
MTRWTTASLSAVRPLRMALAGPVWPLIAPCSKCTRRPLRSTSHSSVAWSSSEDMEPRRLSVSQSSVSGSWS